MGLAYLFALIVGLGILTIQAVMGSKDADAEGDVGADKDFHFDGDAHADLHADADFDADVDADADFDADSVHAGHAGAHTGQELSWAGDFVALFLSVRFWVFASLGFGLSGTLLHYLTSVSVTSTAITALALGLFAGLGAAMAFRALKRTSSQPAEDTRRTVGHVGRVIVPCSEGGLGKVRIELSGQTVDLVARTTGLRIEIGDNVLIEEVEGEVAIVSRAPEELQSPRNR